MAKAMSDTEMIDEMLPVLRQTFQGLFTGYDTFIDRKNFLTHFSDLCALATKQDERLKAIELLASEL